MAGQKLPNDKPRASITFPSELYERLESMAKSKKVSLAWIVREAAERYVSVEGNLTASLQETQRP
jgi:predicted DNA-binding protein